MLIIEVHRVRVGPANVARLLEVRTAALAEFREQVPELRQADLVRLGDDVWLDIRTWMNAVDPATVGRAAQRLPAYAEMQSLMSAQLGHDRGERVHTTGTAWAAGR
jgi:hypothetical protein